MTQAPRALKYPALTLLALLAGLLACPCQGQTNYGSPLDSPRALDQWRKAMVQKIKQANSGGNELKTKRLLEECEKEVKALVGKPVRWTVPVHSVTEKYVGISMLRGTSIYAFGEDKGQDFSPLSNSILIGVAISSEIAEGLSRGDLLELRGIVSVAEIRGDSEIALHLALARAVPKQR